MKKLSLPREKKGYVPAGVYEHPRAERKQLFMELFQPGESDESINRRRMENLRELRGIIIEQGFYIYISKIW